MLKLKAAENELVSIKSLISNARCYETVRSLRWPDGVLCPYCKSDKVSLNGHHKKQTERQKYRCNNCARHFDDLTKTIFKGHHQPLSVWILCLYFMGLNLSNQQIAEELDLNISDVQQMTTLLRQGVADRKPEVTLSGKVECDEVYIVAGHKGNPESVKKMP